MRDTVTKLRGNLVRRTVLLAVLLVTVGTAGACSGGAAEAEAPTAEYVSTIPKPDSAQATELVATLAVIDPALGEDADQTVSRSRSQCESILADAAGALAGDRSLVELVQYRFTGSIAYNDDQAKAINDVIAGSPWCVAG